MNNKLSKYILKHNKRDTDNLKYDFMPEMLEIIERPTNKIGQIIIYIIFSMLIVTIIWACISKTDVVVTAIGSVDTKIETISVKSEINGIVKSVNVKNGQNVKKGDLLIQLEFKSDTDIDLLNEQITILKAELDVYRKIMNNTDISEISASDYDKICKIRIKDILADYNTYLLSKKMFEENDISTNQSKIQNSESKYKAEIDLSYNNAKKELSIYDAQLRQYNEQFDKCKIIAKQSGKISSITVNDVGESIEAEKELLKIVPENESMQMKTYVKNKDIAQINVGDSVSIKLDAYPYSDYGTVSGKITSISFEPEQNETLGSVYRVTADIDNTNKNIKLIKGLNGSMDIKIRERTVISYFLEPVMNGFNNVFKEI